MSAAATSDRAVGITASGGQTLGGLAGLLPLLVAAVLYLVVLVVGGNLLNDPDCLWHLTVGEWILANGLPHSDPFSFTLAGQPWIAKEWLSQLLLVGAFRLGGWPGVVVLAAGSMAIAFGLLTRALLTKLAPTPALVFIAAAFVLTAPHATARPHLLALPVMVAWVAGLVRAADERTGPSPWLLMLMILWANLHGGFVLGILLVGAIGLDAIVSASADERWHTIKVWVGFGVLSVAAACITPYGPESIAVAWRILNLGPALSIISEWRPPDFAHITGLEIVLLGATGFVLYRGVTLPPVRIVTVLGLVHLALSAERNAEVFGLLAPLIVAAPIARQFPSLGTSGRMRPSAPGVVAVLALIAGLTSGAVRIADYRPNPLVTPAAALDALTQTGAGPVLNEYDFGGYLIRAGMATFIDGRTELYGGNFVARYYRAVTLADTPALSGLIGEYEIGATILKPTTPAVDWLDAQPGWRRLYSDDVAVVHIRASP
jgi:hypothetical protein